MFPKALHAYTLEGSRLEPLYLTASDYPWLRALLDLHERSVGLRRREFQREVGRGVGEPAPEAKLRLAAHLLERLTTDRVVSPVAPRRIRAALFRRAARDDRDAALAETSRELGIAPAEVEALLFADLPGERVVLPLSETMGPAVLAARVNSEHVASFLQRASQVRIAAHGNVRALVRHAKIVGLLCVFELQGDQLTMQLSGPYSLFRRTLVYGRALASLLPRLAWCRDFQLAAECVVENAENADGSIRNAELVVTKGDPIEAGRELDRFDSSVEARFARDFARLAKHWELTREPAALPTQRGLFFPDFEIVHRRDERRRWYLEIVGFWTEAYLRDKREALGGAGLENVIVCVDETKACGLEGLPDGLVVIPYRRRVKARQVLDVIEGQGA